MICAIEKQVTQKQTLSDKNIFGIFVKKGEVVEVRILNVWGNSPAWAGFAKGTVSEYFDYFRSFGNAALMAVKKQLGIIYFTLQVIDPRLISRKILTSK
jgi:hypothetical protein